MHWTKTTPVRLNIRQCNSSWAMVRPYTLPKIVPSKIEPYTVATVVTSPGTAILVMRKAGESGWNERTWNAGVHLKLDSVRSSFLYVICSHWHQIESSGGPIDCIFCHSIPLQPLQIISNVRSFNLKIAHACGLMSEIWQAFAVTFRDGSVFDCQNVPLSKMMKVHTIIWLVLQRDKEIYQFGWHLVGDVKSKFIKWMCTSRCASWSGSRPPCEAAHCGNCNLKTPHDDTSL